MANLSSQQVRSALDTLAEVAAERQEEFENYSRVPLQQSFGEENDSDNPVMDSFYNNGGGTKASMEMTNF